MMTGIVDPGGGMRGIYAAGVLDTCLEQGVCFDCCLGVSAGSANLISYLAGQKGRNYRFYHDYSFRSAYMGMGQLLRTGSYLNLSYIYGTLSRSGGEDPLDYGAFRANPARFYAVTEEAVSGRARYFSKDEIPPDDYRPLMASSCVPGIDAPLDIGGTLYYDGGLADPVPLETAFRLGCDRVVLLLTKPLGEIRLEGEDRLLSRLIRRKYPVSAENILLRPERYNAGVRLARASAQKGRVLILAPSDTTGVDTLKRDPASLDALYRRGREDGEAIRPWLAGTG